MNGIDPHAVAIATKLDGLPLALSTAGAFLNQASVSCEKYLEYYETAWAKLQKTSPQLLTYENRALYSTWNISYLHVKKRNESAAMLLKFWAYFSNEDLWYELLCAAGSVSPTWLQLLTTHGLDFTKAMLTLCNHGLAEKFENSASLMEDSTRESEGYSVHGCVHSWMRHILQGTTDVAMAQLAIRCVASHARTLQKANDLWIQRRLLKHADQSSMFMAQMKETQKPNLWVYETIADLYLDQYVLNDAEVLYRQSLQRMEKSIGLNHPSTLAMANKLGSVYWRKGQLNDAEAMYLRVVKGFEKPREPGHGSVLQTIHNPGNFYWRRGQLSNTEAIHQRMLQENSKSTPRLESPEPGDPALLRTVHNLGRFYTSQRRLREADMLCQRAVTEREMIYGPEHAETLVAVNSLGRLYLKRGQESLAETMCLRAMQGLEKEYGLEHPSTQSAAQNLGMIYAEQNRPIDAETMLQRALDASEKARGKDDMMTLEAISVLGYFYTCQNRLTEAEAMYHRALDGGEKIQGPGHLFSLTLSAQLGFVYWRQNRLPEAEAMYQRALHGMDRLQVSNYMTALEVANWLGLCYAAQDRLADAEAMYQRALQGFELTLGPNRMKISGPALDCLENFAALCEKSGKPHEARQFYVRALDGYLHLFGRESQKAREILDKVEPQKLLTYYN